MPDFLERLKESPPVLMDGATGSELERRGLDTSTPAWSALAAFDNPSLLKTIHQEYLEAGAELLTANTFRSHRRALDKVGRGAETQRLTNAAVGLAKEAVQQSGRRAFVAGSIAPLEDCYSPELVPPQNEVEQEHSETVQSLVKAGVDLILVETMNTAREAAAAAQAAEQSGLTFGVSFVCGHGGDLLSGETIKDAVSAVEEFHPGFLAVNCTPAKSLGTALGKLARSSRLPIGAYANNGHSDDFADWEENEELNPEDYSLLANAWKMSGATLLGGCCGTTPDHIAAIELQ